MKTTYHLAILRSDKTILYYISDYYRSELPTVSVDIVVVKRFVELPPDITVKNCYNYQLLDGNICMTAANNTNSDYLQLLSVKTDEAYQLNNYLHDVRTALLKKLPGQDSVYRLKVEQSNAVLDGKNTEVDLVQCYADCLGIDIVNAAKVILEAANQSKKTLIQSEIIRQKFMQEIRQLTTLTAVRGLAKKYIQDNPF